MACDLNSILRTNWQQRPYDPHFREEETEREVVFPRSQGRDMLRLELPWFFLSDSRVWDLPPV